MTYSPEHHSDAFDHEQAEQLLSERLEYITESIQPSLGYEVQLDGVQTSNPTIWGALETYFDTMLDINNGAQLTLDYDPLNDRLALKELSINTAGDTGPVAIRRTSEGYIPIQTIDQAEIMYSKDNIDLTSMGQKSSAIQPYFGERILEAFGIENVPHNDSAQYQLWLSGVLSNTRAWRLTESSEIPLVLTAEATQSMTIKKETVVGESADDFFVTRSLTESITHADPYTSSTLVSESVLELSGDIGRSQMRYFITGFERKPDAFVVDDFTTEQHHETVTPIGESEFSRLRKKLEEVALIKHQLSQLD